MASASREEALEDFRNFSFRSVLTENLVRKSISTITTLLDSNVSPELAAELSRMKDYLMDVDDASKQTYAVVFREFLEVEHGDATRITQEVTQEFELLESQESAGGGGQGGGVPGGSGGRKKGGEAGTKKQQGNHKGETPPKVCLRYSAGVLKRI